jgi:hypothetical protein
MVSETNNLFTEGFIKLGVLPDEKVIELKKRWLKNRAYAPKLLAKFENISIDNNKPFFSSKNGVVLPQPTPKEGRHLSR